jgi:hypothetical protein
VHDEYRNVTTEMTSKLIQSMVSRLKSCIIKEGNMRKIEKSEENIGGTNTFHMYGSRVWGSLQVHTMPLIFCIIHHKSQWCTNIVLVI